MLELYVKSTAEFLLAHKLRIVTAESCTGGGLGFWLTSIAQSSRWFEGGFITYSNQAKIQFLHVPATILDQYGAVSAETVSAMAKGALAQSSANLSIAISGIAGPNGGTVAKPVGTIWLAWALNNDHEIKITTQELRLAGSRTEIRDQTIIYALSTIPRLFAADK